MKIEMVMIANFLKRNWLFFSVFLLSSCIKQVNTIKEGTLIFQGSPHKNAILYKVIDNDHKKKSYYPLLRLTTNTQILLEKGQYFIANECSAYEFYNDGKSVKKVVLSELNLHFNTDSESIKEGLQEKIQSENDDDDSYDSSLDEEKKETVSRLQNKESIFNTRCVDPIDSKEHWYFSKSSFDLLPGESTLSVNGKRVNAVFKPDDFSKQNVELWPLTFNTPSVMQAFNKIFSFPMETNSTEKKYVTSAALNSILWLQTGKYQVEINGTKQVIEVDASSNKEIKLGGIRISSPEKFPYNQRLSLGGQPIFAFINDKVLFSLNEDYPVFPGNYVVNLEGTEMIKQVQVEENKMSILKTLGAVVNFPPCQKKYEKCMSSARITIHSNHLPFILTTVVTNIPFLVFDDKFDFGVEGIKGIFKPLNTSSESVGYNNVKRVRIKWNTKFSEKNIKTDLVRFEAKGSQVFGKSIDLMYFKPEEIYLPEGDYLLSYFVGDQNSILPKTLIDVPLFTDVTKEVSIPIYTVVKEQTVEKNQDNSNNSFPTTLHPIQN